MCLYSSAAVFSYFWCLSQSKPLREEQTIVYLYCVKFHRHMAYQKLLGTSLPCNAVFLLPTSTLKHEVPIPSIFSLKHPQRNKLVLWGQRSFLLLSDNIKCITLLENLNDGLITLAFSTSPARRPSTATINFASTFLEQVFKLRDERKKAVIFIQNTSEEC